MQQLESIVIHWTRQIKDVVNNHDNALTAEILGPLEEIEVWQMFLNDVQGCAVEVYMLSAMLEISRLQENLRPRCLHERLLKLWR